MINKRTGWIHGDETDHAKVHFLLGSEMKKIVGVASFWKDTLRNDSMLQRPSAILGRLQMAMDKISLG